MSFLRKWEGEIFRWISLLPFYRFSGSRLYSRGTVFFNHPLEKHALPELRRRAMHQRLPFPWGGCHPPSVVLFSPLHRRYYRRSEWQRTRPSSEQPWVSKGWGGRCSVTMETRRAVRHPFPRCIQPWVDCDPRSKMQRYLDNGNYPRQGHVSPPRPLLCPKPWRNFFLFRPLSRAM